MIEKNHYRADIDGLRAIAIIAVVFYHMDFSWIKGGFVGVDIFFVISGFLITKNIERELNTNQFSFKDFYFKRVRRIFPSLLIVSASTLLIGFFLLLNFEFKALCEGILTSSLFLSNFWLYFQSGYFDHASFLKPMLHLWSLAVEEQFYLIWPILLFYIPKNKKTQYLISLCIISFIYSVLSSKSNPSAAFYLISSRFWQLGMGGLLAIYQFKKTENNSNLILNNLLSLLGLLLVFYAICKFDKNTIYPGYDALIPTMATALIIFAGSNAIINKKFLSNKLALSLGRVSYPLYLWHWPLLYFLLVSTKSHSTFLQKLIVILISFGLSYTTQLLWESKFLKLPTDSPLLKKLILYHLWLAIFSQFLFYIGNIEGNSNSLTPDQSFTKRVKDECSITNGELLDYKTSCSREKTNLNTKLILGDSHAISLYPGLVNSNSTKEGWEIVAKANCAPHKNECESFFNEAAKSIKSNHEISEIIIAFSARLLDTNSSKHLLYEKNINTTAPKIVEEKMLSFLHAIDRENLKIKFFISPPAIIGEPQLCFPRPFLNSYIDTHSDCTISRDDVEQTMKEYRELIGRIAIKFPKLTIIDPIDIFCTPKECSVIDNKGLSKYSYSDHPSYLISLKMANLINAVK